jgi:hypothetical protein
MGRFLAKTLPTIKNTISSFVLAKFA